MKKIKRFGYIAAAAGVLCMLVGMIAFVKDLNSIRRMK